MEERLCLLARNCVPAAGSCRAAFLLPPPRACPGSRGCPVKEKSRGRGRAGSGILCMDKIANCTSASTCSDLSTSWPAANAKYRKKMILLRVAGLTE